MVSSSFIIYSLNESFFLLCIFKGGEQSKVLERNSKVKFYYDGSVSRFIFTCLALGLHLLVLLRELFWLIVAICVC